MAGILLPAYEKDRWVLKGRLGANPDGLAYLGRWGRLAYQRPFTITIGPTGIDGAISQVQLYVSNQDAEPPPLTAGVPPISAAPLAQPFTQPQSVAYDLPYGWVCVVIAAGGKPTVIDLAAG